MGSGCSSDQRTSPYLSAETLETNEKVQKEKAIILSGRIAQSGKTDMPSLSTNTFKGILYLKHASVPTAKVHRLPADRVDRSERSSERSVHFPTEKLIPQTIWDAQITLTMNQCMREVFMSYFYSYAWTDQLTDETTAAAFSSTKRRPTNETCISFNDYTVKRRTSSSDSKEMESVATTMMRCTQLKIRDSMESTRRKAHVECVFASGQLANILIASLWPLFVLTDAYTMAMAGINEPFLLYEDPTGSATPKHENDKQRQLKELYVQTVQHLSEYDLEQLLKRGKWCEACLQHLEELPFSLSLTRSTPHTNMAIVFVNRAFEAMTQYPRTEVLGNGHELLQCINTEVDQLAKIRESLSKHEAVKVAITNKRKHGQEFLNFLALKPILSREDGGFSLTLGIQYDISTTNASLKELKMINDCLSIVGNMLRG